MYDDICACSELRDCCFKKAEQARELHFSAFTLHFNYNYVSKITSQ